MIKKENGMYVLYSKDGKKVLGKHKTRAKAVAQEHAIKISKGGAFPSSYSSFGESSSVRRTTGKKTKPPTVTAEPIPYKPSPEDKAFDAYRRRQAEAALKKGIPGYRAEMRAKMMSDIIADLAKKKSIPERTKQKKKRRKKQKLGESARQQRSISPPGGGLYGGGLYGG